jgi:hypothetical protein
MAARSEAEVIAQEVSALGGRVAAIEARLGEIDGVVARLEGAALTTAQALQEVPATGMPSPRRCGVTATPTWTGR